MKGGPELGPTSAIAGGAAPGRSAHGAAAKEATRGSSPFEALLAQIHPDSHGKGARGAKAGTSRMVPAPLGADARRSKPDGAGEEVADASREAAAPAVTAEVVTLETGTQAQGLAQALGLRVAAALDGASGRAAGEDLRAGARPDRRDAAPATTLALAVSAARRAELGGAPPRPAPELSVTRSETHFGPVLTAGTSPNRGAAQPPSVLADADPLSAVSGRPGAHVGPERLAFPRGRAEQMTIAGRAAPGEGRGPRGEALGASPGATLRAAAAEGRPSGAASTGADAIDGTLLQAGAAAGGPGAARVPGAAPVQATQAPLPAAPTGFAGGFGPLRVLHIQLQPAELGALEVRMRLTDAGLEIHIEASRHETLTLLKNDRETLAQVLRGTGHAVDAVTVSLADRSAPQGQASQDGWQQPSSGARPDAQSGAPRDQGSRPDERAPSRPDGEPVFDKVRDDQDRPALAARNGDLYL